METLDKNIELFTNKKELFKKINRGIERECLRVNKQGDISQSSHPKELGSALTNPKITTDYAESLLEFVTGTSDSVEETLKELKEIHQFTVKNISSEEFFWGQSMPNKILNEDDIKIGEYGPSNVGQMKHIYRKGLKNRYGSLMQVISGIHYNFSFPKEVFQHLHQAEKSSLAMQDYITDKYFGMIRNIQRYGWTIPYLFGASPFVHESFLKNDCPNLKKFPNKDVYYGQYATSLRMSEIGYTSNSQKSITVCFNQLSSYINSLKDAIETKYDDWVKIGVKVDGEYRQLRDSIIQIENEYYGHTRPKRVVNSGEPPSKALSERGIEYIELRSMDINPNSDIGITSEQAYYLDLFFLFCLLEDSPSISKNECQDISKNQKAVILEGRDPNLLLSNNGQETSINSWGSSILDKMEKTLPLFSSLNLENEYDTMFKNIKLMFSDPGQTYSGKLLTNFKKSDKSYNDFFMNIAIPSKEKLFSEQLDSETYDKLSNMAQKSLAEKEAIERKETIGLDEYLENYYSQLNS
jgi:glutamate--cysteine ligase